MQFYEYEFLSVIVSFVHMIFAEVPSRCPPETRKTTQADRHVSCRDDADQLEVCGDTAPGNQKQGMMSLIDRYRFLGGKYYNSYLIMIHLFSNFSCKIEIHKLVFCRVAMLFDGKAD